MKFLAIYLFIGLISSVIMNIADRKGIIGEENELDIRDHLILILLWPVVLLSTISNIMNNQYGDDDNDDSTESYY